MFKYPMFILLALLTLGCKNHEFSASEIERIEYQVVNSGNINHGDIIDLEVVAVLNDGKKQLLNFQDSLSVSSSSLWQTGETQFIINEHPTSFADTFYTLRFRYSDTSGIFSQRDTLILNYQSPIQLIPSMQKQKHGSDQRKRSSTLFGRDGVNGEKGGNGTHGTKGLDCVAWVWQQGNELRMYVEVDSLNVSWKYKSYLRDTLIISIPGNRGGNGGKGGDGGNGKDAKGSKMAGNGGDGGDGGDAGNGGNGGSVLLFVHENAQHLVDHIHVYNPGGVSGVPGQGGKGGSAGKPKESRPVQQVIDGKPGSPGTSGKNGKAGPKPVISVTIFDYTRFN